MWPKILERYPSASLHIHTDIHGEWSNKTRPYEMKEIMSCLEKTDSVVYHGWTDKKKLALSWKSADIWFYPCTYLETFCHTALEAAITKTLVVTSNLAALKDTVGDRGILIDGDFYQDDIQNKGLEELFRIIENNDEKERLLLKNYKWAIQKTWETQATELLKILD
jgi:glycosyltransferase involved in cell wall biosynthesis